MAATARAEVSAHTDYHSFFWRRLHSITGIVPIGAFLLEHLLSNAAVLSSHPARSYADQVRFLNSLPFVLVLEIAFIYLPLAFHGIYGLRIVKQAEPNALRYAWLGNWAYTWQRISGVFLFIFILWHTWTARFSGVNLPDHPEMAFAKMAAEMANPWLLIFFIAGTTLAAYHFAYGLYLFTAKWGITVGAAARRIWAWICLAIGVALTYAGLASALAFRGVMIYPVR